MGVPITAHAHALRVPRLNRPHRLMADAAPLDARQRWRGRALLGAVETARSRGQRLESLSNAPLHLIAERLGALEDLLFATVAALRESNGPPRAFPLHANQVVV